jgi:hypothetical protein
MVSTSPLVAPSCGPCTSSRYSIVNELCPNVDPIKPQLVANVKLKMHLVPTNFALRAFVRVVFVLCVECHVTPNGGKKLHTRGGRHPHTPSQVL